MHRGYTNLVNGLQPLDRLRSNYAHEWQEFYEKVAEDASRVEVLHEAADIRYYAAQLEEHDQPGYWPVALEELQDCGLSEEHIDKAALAKYG
jgi:hypothetical protein